MRPLLGPTTVLLPAMNGVPWWLLPAAMPAQAPLASVDPGGAMLARLPLERVLGCVVHLAASSPSPGRVRHTIGERLIVGEPAGGVSARVDAVCAALASAGFQAEASADIRIDVWYKLWGNMTINPVSALTGALTDAILDDALVRDFVLRCMTEAAEIGARIGCPIVQSGADRLDLTRELGGFRTSMLQDADAGRTIELDALVTAVHEIAGRVGVAAPNIGALLGLTRLMARGRGLYES
jgi:2-dehydropantoate 2-reductase